VGCMRLCVNGELATQPLMSDCVALCSCSELLYRCACQCTARRYTRIALGKSSAMDVVAGESSGGTGQLFILYPLLIRGSCLASACASWGPARRGMLIR
jgi:hypothetical protein